jgi:serine/threonine protein kinase
MKPENIMFRTTKINSEIVILDFGLSTFCDEKEYIYTRCGTPGFVAPEIVNIKDMTTKCKSVSDVFSLGVIFHILLLGKSPFKGKTFNEVLSENRQCNFTLQGPEYTNLPAEGNFSLIQLTICSRRCSKSNHICVFLRKSVSDMNSSSNRWRSRSLSLQSKILRSYVYWARLSLKTLMASL